MKLGTPGLPYKPKELVATDIVHVGGQPLPTITPSDAKQISLLLSKPIFFPAAAGLYASFPHLTPETLPGLKKDAEAVTPGAVEIGHARGGINEAWAFVGKLSSTVGGAEATRQTVHIAEITRNASQAEVASKLRLIGVTPAHLESTTNGVLDMFHSRSADAIFVGVAAGGSAYAIMGLFPNAPLVKKYRKELSIAFGVLAALLVLFVLNRPEPLAAKWCLDPNESSFESMVSPRSLTETITEDATGLKVQDKGIASDGSPFASTYHLNVDGREYKQTNGDVIVTTRQGLATRSTVRAADHHDRLESRTLSHDERQLTEDLRGTRTDGKPFHDVRVFEKSKE